MSGTDQNHVGDSIPWLQWRPWAGIAFPVDHKIFGLNKSKPEQNIDTLLIILISLLTLTTFLALFVFRSLDDNRLTSWQWVFAGDDALKIVFILVIGVFLAYVVSSISLSIRKPAIGLFIFSFIISALSWAEPEVIVDASRYFVQAKFLELYGIGYFFSEWGKEIAVWTDLPLVPLLYGLVFKFFGEHRIGIQLFNSLLFSGTAVLTYLIGKTLWNETVGLYGGVLLLGIPFLLTQVPLMLVDVATMFFFTLALFTTIKAVKQGGTALLLLASVTIVLAMLTKYSVWLMLSVIPVVFVSHFEYGKKTLLRRATVITLATFFLIGIVLLWNFNVFAEQLKLLLNYQVPGLKRWGESLASTFFFQVHPYITVAALFSTYVAIRKKDLKFLIIGWLLLLVIVLEIKRARYLIVIFPMLVLMAAYGINEIRNVKINRFIVSSTVASALVITFFGYLPFLQKTSAINLSQAGKYLDSIDTGKTQEIEVITLPQANTIVNPAVSVPVLDLFTQKTLVYRDDKGLIPDPRLIEKSPLRFTWAYRNPKFFSQYFFTNGGTSPGILKKRIPVVIIFGDASQANSQGISDQITKRIEGYRLAKELTIIDKVFRYQTLIRVYQPV